MSLTTMIFIASTILLSAYFLRASRRSEMSNRAVLEESQREGLIEPPTLHPVIDLTKCLGCGSCAAACPEQNVLGVVDGKAQLVNPSHCIGHGACKSACPSDAISLVFGTEQRGVDIPMLHDNFETNVPGIFIAGELGGMGLIRNAFEQGRQAVDSIRELEGIGGNGMLDLVIVGAGPAGFSASLAAKQHGMRFVTLEQDSLGGTIAHYPRGKLVMTAPGKLPIVGKVPFKETTKEELLQFLKGAEQKSELKINYGERVENIARNDNGFEVRSARETYQTRAVLLAIGRRGTPRKLGVQGEEQEKVVYRMIDPEQYRGRRVLVVGGGDSALEAAMSIAEQPGTNVSISYRSGGFSRAKPKNRQKMQRIESAGQLQLLLKSNVQSIEAERVVLEQEGREVELDNDAVIVCAGGILPTPFLREIGIEVETKHGSS